MSISIIKGTLGTSKFIRTYRHQSTLLLANGSIGIGTYIICIDNGITRCGIDGKTIVEHCIIGIQLTIHGIAVTAQIVNAINHRGSVRRLATNLIPTQEVACVVGTIRYYYLILVNTIGCNIPRITALARTPGKAGKAIRSRGTDHILTIENLGSSITLIEFVPLRRGSICSRKQFMHQPSHHHSMTFYTHSSGTDIRTQQP